VETGDAAFLVGGTIQTDNSGFDLWLLKVDSAGDTIWTQAFGSDSHEWINSVIETSDGHYLAVGMGYREGGLGGWNGWLAKIDSEGNVLWTQRTEYEAAFYTVIEASDQSYMVAGSTFNVGFGGNKGLLMKVDQDGNTLWSRNYLMQYDDFFNSVIEISDSDFLLTGEAHSVSTELWLQKVDASGEVIWSRTYTGSTGNTALEISDEGYIVSGSIYTDSNSWEFWLFKTDYDGNTIGYSSIENELSQPSINNIVLFPNPVNNSCNIKYTLSAKTSVAIRIYDLLGTCVWSHSQDERLPGSYNIVWDTNSNEGRSLSSGIYIAKISTVNDEKAIKISLLK